MLGHLVFNGPVSVTLMVLSMLPETEVMRFIMRSNYALYYVWFYAWVLDNFGVCPKRITHRGI